MIDNKVTIPRAYTYEDLARKKYKTLPLKGVWKEHLGEIERSGSILIYGDSGHGKTTYALQLMRELCQGEKVLYNSLEECGKLSLLTNLERAGLKQYKNKYLVCGEPLDNLIQRLSRPQQPKIVFIDSVQAVFRGKKTEDYHNLILQFPQTLFIGISQMRKGMPKGAVAEEFYWFCQDRVLVQDFNAYIEKTRTGGNELEPYIISEIKAGEREAKMIR
jgi:hypothetical protein